MVFLLIMVASWVAVQSTWLERELDGIFKRVNFSRERAFSGERNSRARRIQERDSRGRGEVCPGYLTSALRPHPNGCLDQLDPMLALGTALLLHPINKSTSWSVTLIKFYIFLQSILLDGISITRI